MSNYKRVERSLGALKVKNFHCSEHGYIKPRPTCPKCEATTKENTLQEVEEWVEERIERLGVVDEHLASDLQDLLSKLKEMKHEDI